MKQEMNVIMVILSLFFCVVLGYYLGDNPIESTGQSNQSVIEVKKQYSKESLIRGDTIYCAYGWSYETYQVINNYPDEEKVFARCISCIYDPKMVKFDYSDVELRRIKK